MYYPFLRARQFELIALRELAAENAIQRHVTPVLEPVKATFNNLKLAHAVFTETNLRCNLIVNPLVGEATGDTNIFLDFLNGTEYSHFTPAFHYTNNSEYILRCIQQYNLEDCLIICHNNFNDGPGIRQLCGHQSVSSVMVFDPQKYRSLDRYLKGQNIHYIRFDDVFEKQLKNADFLEIPAHKFTEEHLYYREENFYGFSDFTVLPSEYVDGGSTPRAVVIHLTYLDPAHENEIWIRHFTSNTNDSIANVQGKFGEAAQKAIRFCDQSGLNNSAIAELRAYFDQGRYPGLGMVKKISIKNHLTVVNNFLTQRNA